MLKSLFCLVSFLTLESIHTQNRSISIDTNYIYSIPLEPGKKAIVMQGYNGKYSHQGNYALDFKAKKGTPIYAAREGIVYKTEDSNIKGGPKKKFLSFGNHIIIKHFDGTYASYWHLMYKGVKVNVGDTISKGQFIGFSGNTGYSSWAHLHFDVYYFSKGKQQTIPTLFETTKGIIKLKVYHSYTKPKENTISIPRNIDQIEYRYQDASVPPEHHRSYTWKIKQGKAQYIVESYGTIIKDTTIEISDLKWEQCKTAFLNCGIKNQQESDNNQGCTGGTAITIKTWLNGKETFSGTSYSCGGKKTGNLIGDTDHFLLNIEMGIDPSIFKH